MSAFIVIGLCFIPWIPILIDQYKLMENSSFYFMGRNSLLKIIIDITDYNFFRYQFFENLNHGYLIIAFKVIFRLFIAFLIIIGFLKLWDKRINRSLSISLVLYVVMLYFVDLFLNLKTLNVPKLHFFIMPVFLMILSVGFIKLPLRNYFKIPTGVILVILLSYNLFQGSQRKFSYDSASFINKFSGIINDISNKDQQYCSLVITNTNQRRYLLPVIHGMGKNVDFMICPGDLNPEKMEGIRYVKQYKNIFIAGMYVPYLHKRNFSDNDIEIISEYLSLKGYNKVRQLYNYQDSFLLLYKNE
ncbi:MAG: hypothetical protein KAG99_04865 [Bacteroidales bacterium]|nr:hypothetical protein [Bacteroidales bacterium]